MSKRTIPSTCWECGTLCGALLTLGEDGRVTKVAPNPAHPTSKGAFCVKGIRGLPEWTDHPDRLLHPIRRIGPRGSGEWRRISWEEALEEVAEGLAKVRAEHGPLALVGAVSGAFFSRGAVVALLMRSLGSPNWMINQDLCGGCRAVSDRMTGLNIGRGEEIEAARCTLMVGRNPHAADPIQWAELKRAKARGARLVVLDPFRTPAAELADVWLQSRPGTDGAIGLALLHAMIRDRRYDAGFVARWCHGFAALAARVAPCTPDWAAGIAGVAAADIERAAALYADGPSTFVGGHGIDAASNGVQTYRAFHCLVAISGNLDRVGGNRRVKKPAGFRTYLELLHDKRFRLPEAVERQTIGADRFPLWAGPEGWQTACHNASVIEAMLTGAPYPVRGAYVSGVNIAVTYPDARRTLAALRSLDFLAVAAHTMTPTAAVADIVLPKTTTLEEEEVTLDPSGPNIAYTAAVPARGEARSDLGIAAGLMEKLRARGALTAELLPWRSQAAFNDFLLGESGISLEALRRDGYAHFPYTRGDFEHRGFATPSGRIELYSESAAKHGLDPLPGFLPPPEASEPLLLQTGFREKTYHHSRFRDQAWARKVSPDPEVRLHPETAAAHGVAEGDWVEVELPDGPGACRLRVTITDRTQPGVLTTGMGWWLPEAPGPEFAALEINVNAALSYRGATDPMSGSVNIGALPCRMRKVEAAV
ncbi:molybdopterin-dependent oxidoreductase [Siccirubricoccus sp. KC 17139]|uniref:Molybdopterin-dependent oxidoreductase n=1 Tax=Siccirubricoccus soli TaxID=2899147 RepID=A0ABT1DAN7_9PROT|nr:molybdopterin-dependent oxidoreductase [Siccirubricoccus soli]MCO6419007.1 molybdopterin-dependent oxidoreductase [Siccirubricoccus soli]MCP2685142.1 molybdopterin-dependent oxidoreductase [Siccirubricoccus soli]